MLISCLALLIDSAHAANTTAGAAPDWPAAIRQRNAEMKRRVDTWLKGGRDQQTPLHVVYLTCQDQKPFPQHRERLNRVLTEVQAWFADQHESLGFGRATIHLNRDEDGKVRLLQGEIPFDIATRNFKNLRQTSDACVKTTRELLAKEGVDYDQAFVLILTTIPDDHRAAPFFGRPQQTRGVCFAVDTPWLDSAYTQTTGRKVWKGRPIGPANSALVGGIVHELVHGFGLYHCDENAPLKRFGESLMGSGNYTWRQEKRGEGRGTFLLDSDAMQLIARPPFARRVRDFGRAPKVSVVGLKIEQAAADKGQVRVSGRFKSDIPVYGVRLFDDPPGNRDYNAVAHVALPDEKTGAFSITFQPLQGKGEHELRLYAYHVNGHWSRWTDRIIVGDRGAIDLSKTKRR